MHGHTVFSKKLCHGPVSGQSRQYKIPVISGLQPYSQRKHLPLFLQKSSQRRNTFIQFSHSSCKDQFLFCPGHSHIQYSQLLSQTFLKKLSSYHLFIQGGRNDSFFRKYCICPQSQLRMDQQSGIQILEIKLFSHSCRKHHRKFQSLAFMNGHNFYRCTSCTCQIDLSVIHFISLKLFNITDKVK